MKRLKKLILIFLVSLGVFGLGDLNTKAQEVIQFGHVGEGVRRVQEMLSRTNYYAYKIDGMFGKITENAVIRFQIEKGIRVDGMVGPQTNIVLSQTLNRDPIVLRQGNEGYAVVSIQKRLNQLGYYNATVDGIFGELTHTAVVKFQKNASLLIDGIVGQKTYEALQSASWGWNFQKNYTENDLYWLSRIIHAEAAGEPYLGQVAVGNVVLNRVASNQFPNSVYGVIFDYHYHIPQFSPVQNGAIYQVPSKISIQAAKEALEGRWVVGSSTYFFNPDKAKGLWIVNHKNYVTRIGEHVFYS